MSTNPDQDQNSDQLNQYGGYTGYTPPTQNPPQSSQSQGGGTGEQQDYQYGQYTYGQQQQQQYSAYQPPQSAQRRGGSSGGSASEADDITSLGLNGRTAAAASYVLVFLSGIVFFILERKNRFVRFCAAQSTLFFGAVFVVYLFLRLLTIIPLLGFLLSPIIGCLVWLLLIASALIWVFLILQAYRGVKVKLPFFGDIAENLTSGTKKR